MKRLEEYRLKLSTGITVTWTGSDGEDAAIGYLDNHREQEGLAVMAWKKVTTGVFPYGAPACVTSSPLW
jgi:hypothetical protein